MVGLGVTGILIWLGVRAIGRFKAMTVPRKKLNLSRIEKTLRARGMSPEKSGEKQLQFRHFFNDIQWTAQYEEEIGRLVIGYVFPLDNPADAKLAADAAAEVMAKYNMVRLFVKPQGERQLFFFTIETFLTMQADFERFLDRYLELIVDAMKEHNALCVKAVEERSQTKERPKIGFVNPLREKIEAFDKANPEATEAERILFIKTIRKD
jgi:hypothetical protein